MQKKYYITTPIYYVNDLPHIGHMYTTVAADILARWYRLNGKEVFFATGTDEHGAKISQAAQKRGIEPKAFCDEISGEFKKCWDELLISYDHFIRTTDADHEATVSAMLQKMYDNGNIYKHTYSGLYCIHCEKFLAEGDLIDGLCPDHKQKPSKHHEENWFFRLSKYKDRLLEILTNQADKDYIKVLPQERSNEVIGKLKISLDDISISRAKVEWGIPLPFDKTQTTYVWVDALINYVTAAGFQKGENEFASTWPADVHLMAKDILWFHSVIWPAMLLSTGMALPKTVFSHGFFTINGEKMSKTLGNVILPRDMVLKFGIDGARYLCQALFPFGTDGDISWTALNERYNSDLANNIGNLVSRTITMIEKYFPGQVLSIKGSENLFENISRQLAAIYAHYELIELHKVCDKIRTAVDLANRFIEETAPWKLAKENSPRLPGVLYALVNSIGLIALYLQPFMPQKAKAIWECCGFEHSIEEASKEYFINKKIVFFPCKPVKKPEALFPRISLEK